MIGCFCQQQPSLIIRKIDMRRTCIVKMHPLSSRIDDFEYEQLWKNAGRIGISLSEYIRKICIEELITGRVIKEMTKRKVKR